LTVEDHPSHRHSSAGAFAAQGLVHRPPSTTRNAAVREDVAYLVIRSILATLLLATAVLAQEPRAAGYPPTPGTGTFTTIEGLEYAKIGNDSLLLDLRIPDGSGPWPVILYLHSGAWITGDRTGGPAIRQASRGYTVASID
jgi:acetyl esterase/lipase